MVLFSLRRASNVHRQLLDVDKATRAELKGQRPVALWFTGLSGAGKSTIANAVEEPSPHGEGTRMSSTGTTSVAASTATSGSRTPTGSRTSAASPRSRSCSWTRGSS